jgi:hypothetical protein
MMAGDAVLVKDRSDVVRERYFGGGNRKRQTNRKEKPHLHS